MAYPTTLDNFTNPLSTDVLTSPSHADQHSDINDAVEAIEAKVGIDSSADTDSHDYKIATLETDIDGYPEADQVVTLTGSQILTNKTLTTPTIGSYVNATHTHLSDATGGSLDIFSDTATESYTPYGMGRQAAMNANFDIWQRGTSGSPVDVTQLYLADRWYDYAVDDGGTLPTLTRSRQALTVGELLGSFYYSRLATNGAGTSLGANSRHGYTQAIEFGTRFLCGLDKKVTVSFYARSSIANKRIGVRLIQTYGSGGSPSSVDELVGTNWTLTSSWVRYSYTFTTATLSGKTFGTANNDCLYVSIYNMWGENYKTVVGATTTETYVGSGNIDIAQVQVNSGSVDLPFCPKSYVEELTSCQRHYQTLTRVVGYGTGSTTAVGFIIPLVVNLWTTPTITCGAGNAIFSDSSVKTIASQTATSVYLAGTQVGGNLVTGYGAYAGYAPVTVEPTFYISCDY